MTKTAADRQREGYQHWDMVTLGWKYNMDNIQAALLLPQMDRLERQLEAAARAGRALRGTAPGHPRALLAAERRPACGTPGTSSRSGSTAAGATAWCEALQDAGIGIVVNYRAIHLLTYFRETFGFAPGSLPSAERIGDATLSLPFYANMPDAHVDIVADALKAVL